MLNTINKKVSIITPCYNGEKHLSYFIDSILNQTYNNIEFIFINDGSIDKTEEIVQSYKDKFIKKGISFIYIYQNNQGQAAALNNGLKKFTGEFLTWPDSDDILLPDSIEKKVNYLEKNIQYGFVRSAVNFVEENNLNKVINYHSNEGSYENNEDLFEDFIRGNNIIYCGGCYLVWTYAFLDVNPMKDIYISRGGQNYQMLLPLANKYKCGYINEPLYICY